MPHARQRRARLGGAVAQQAQGGGVCLQAVVGQALFVAQMVKVAGNEVGVG